MLLTTAVVVQLESSDAPFHLFGGFVPLALAIVLVGLCVLLLLRQRFKSRAALLHDNIDDEFHSCADSSSASESSCANPFDRRDTLLVQYNSLYEAPEFFNPLYEDPKDFV